MEDYIKRALLSILNQSFQDFEIIIIIQMITLKILLINLEMKIIELNIYIIEKIWVFIHQEQKLFLMLMENI